jgi:hypothetical protein
LRHRTSGHHRQGHAAQSQTGVAEELAAGEVEVVLKEWVHGLVGCMSVSEMHHWRMMM